ncbi:serine kinase [Sphingorhabdus sp. Alg239-R122]|uniref:HPr kinase/phosphorylase n=1 Tax=Sphingorhabdus sp. Alg239-R122 TaxID=2305989 RepID=UPI0013DA0B5B|nr:serine kinase [Sphingorhabdus sp. Alg239-R122]
MTDREIIYPACSVCVEGSAILVAGISGSGKSELCLHLVDRGAILISDDQTLLKNDAGKLYAYPAPNIAGRIEVRNLGIMKTPYASKVPVGLIIVLEKEAPRFINAPGQEIIGDIKIPRIKMDAHGSALSIKAEWALRAYGLSL